MGPQSEAESRAIGNFNSDLQASCTLRVKKHRVGEVFNYKATRGKKKKKKFSIEARE